MKRHIVLFTILTGLLLAAVPATAGHGGRGHWGEEQIFRLDLGLFEPSAESRYWDDKALDFTGGPEDFEDGTFGVSYVRFLGDRLGLEIGGKFFEGSAEQAYIDFVDDRGGDIFHRTQLDVSAVTLGLTLALAPRDAPIVPYVGLGGGLYAYELIEEGDFIDFDAATPVIFNDFFVTDGSTTGYYWQAGIEIPAGRSWAVFAEGRWHNADDELDGDFDGFGELDLSGRELSAGISFSF